MEAFSIVVVTALSIIGIYLAFRCITLTKALAKYHQLIMCMVTDEAVKENLMVLVGIMYGIKADEADRRLKNEH